MKTFAFHSWLTLGLLGLLVSLAASPAAAQEFQLKSYRSLKPGVVHPDFELPSIQDRQPIQLSKFRGKKLLLMHFASW